MRGFTTTAVAVALGLGAIWISAGRDAASPGDGQRRRRAALLQSMSATQDAHRDESRDAWWWGMDPRRVPADRVKNDVDTSHIDEVGMSFGRLPPPPRPGAERRSNNMLKPFAGFTSAYQLGNDGQVSVVCYARMLSEQAAEERLNLLVRALIIRFGINRKARPVTIPNGPKMFAVVFAERASGRRVHSAVLDRIFVSQEGRTVDFDVIMRPVAPALAPNRPA